MRGLSRSRRRGRAGGVREATAGAARLHDRPTTETARLLAPPLPMRSSCRLALEQPLSFPVRLTPSGRLDLAPVPTLAASVGCIAALADDALEAPFLGHAQQRQAVWVA